MLTATRCVQIQSDLTGDGDREKLLFLPGLLLTDLPLEAEETGDRDLDSDLQEVSQTKSITHSVASSKKTMKPTHPPQIPMGYGGNSVKELK